MDAKKNAYTSIRKNPVYFLNFIIQPQKYEKNEKSSKFMISMGFGSLFSFLLPYRPYEVQNYFALYSTIVISGFSRYLLKFSGFMVLIRSSVDFIRI